MKKFLIIGLLFLGGCAKTVPLGDYNRLENELFAANQKSAKLEGLLGDCQEREKQISRDKKDENYFLRKALEECQKADAGPCEK